MRSANKGRSANRIATGRAKTTEPLSESIAIEEQAWWVRSERVLTWGNACFDENLKRLANGARDGWLEVRLIREESQPENLATLEIRTRLAITDKRHSGESVLGRIKKLQREFAARCRLAVPEAGSMRPYVVQFDRPAVVRAYGRRSVVALQDEAIELLQSLLFVGSMWRIFFEAGHAFSAVTVYLLALNAAEKNDWRNLFRGYEGRGSQVRPILDLELVIAVGRELGFDASENGAVRSRPERVGDSDDIRRRTAGLAAQELARRYKRKAVTIRRDVINPIVQGALAGTLHMMTEKQAKVLRRNLSRARNQE